MKPFKVRKNKLMNTVIGAPILFMLIGGLILLVDGRSDQFYLALLLTVVPSGVLTVIIYQRIRDKPLLIFDTEGIFFAHLNRKINWINIAYLQLEEEDLTIKDAPGSGLNGIKHYFVVFEITERKEGEMYGFEQKLNISTTNLGPEKLLDIAFQYKKNAEDSSKPMPEERH